MVKHNEFNCRFESICLIANSWMSGVRSLHNPVSGAARPKLRGVTTVVGGLDIDLKSSCLR
jgi:hypothetical protein